MPGPQSERFKGPGGHTPLVPTWMEDAPRPADEVAWLVEENASGVIHWIALAKDAWPRTELRDRRLGARRSTVFERYLSPVERVKDASQAIRFARREDAEAFIALFDRFLLCPIATEHAWLSRTEENTDV